MKPHPLMGSGKIIPHSKRSPPATWKESLRHACLDRARQRLGKQQHRTAEQIIHWEMQQSGVSVRLAIDEATNGYAEDSECHDYCVTEDEWIHLIEQVEAELTRIRTEQEVDEQDMYLEHQIASYEVSLEQEQLADGDSSTICPICWNGPLTLTNTNEIVCSNFMDGSCNMRIAHSSQGSIQTLKELLKETIERHSFACPGTVSFQMDPKRASLLARCLVCNGSHSIRL